MSKRIDCVLDSSLNSRKIPYRVLTPECYEGSEKPFTAIYLLHGLFGSYENWTELTSLDIYADDSGAIIVMPEGGDSWYTDNVQGEANESYLILELIPEVDRYFRTDKRRGARAIVGNSMGGYGVFKLGMKYPDLFALVGSFSGAFAAPNFSGSTSDNARSELEPSILSVFGEPGSLTRRANDLEVLFAGLSDSEIGRLPYFYFDCGLSDEFLDANRALAGSFSDRNVEFEFHESGGGHDWEYWDQQVRNFLAIADRRLS
jgi:S-formylglutathione hydrolase FrmB